MTLGDEEARARRSQKSILERKAPPTFYFLIEMRERHYWVTHKVLPLLSISLYLVLALVSFLYLILGLVMQTEKSVDMLLRGQNPSVEVILHLAI